MFTCSVCGKKFRTMQALGGHVGRAHPQNKGEDMPQSNNPEPVETEEVAEAIPEESSQTQPSDDSPGVMENIRNLRRQGYTARQVKEEFGYARSTVDQVFAEFIEPEGKTEGDDREAGLPVTTKGTEIITPEAIMQRLANGSEDWHLRLEGMMLLRAAQRMNRDDIEMTRMQAEADATRIKPILDLMKETRLEQDAAAQRAKESNIEIAERTAYDTATQLSQVISQNNTRITDSINQIRQAMGGKEENPLGQVLNAMQSMQQMMGMFGVSMPGMPGMPGAQGGGPPPAQWEPPAITHRKRNESQGGEENV
ncbi:C2H2-type zinc finger protein [Chloroflexota bacterium]